MVCFFMSKQVQDPVEDGKRPLLAETTMLIDDAARMYGVGVRTIRRWISDGRLRGYRFGGKSIRVSIEDLEALYEPIGPGE